MVHESDEKHALKRGRLLCRVQFVPSAISIENAGASRKPRYERSRAADESNVESRAAVFYGPLRGERSFSTRTRPYGSNRRMKRQCLDAAENTWLREAGSTLQRATLNVKEISLTFPFVKDRTKIVMKW